MRRVPPGEGIMAVVKDKDNDATPDSGAFVCVSISVVGLLVFATMMVAHLAGADAGSYADWLAATSTLAAFSAAIAAGWYAKQAYDLETTRDKRRDMESRQSQAAKVAAWFGAGHKSTESLGSAHGAQVDGIYYRNASDVPVTDVQVQLWLHYWLTVEAEHSVDISSVWDPLLEPARQDLVPPADATFFVPLDHDQAERLSRAKSAAAESANGDVVVRASIRFRDASGRYWTRDRDGELSDEWP